MKFYISSCDPGLDREVVIDADNIEAALVALWERELRDFRAIPAESLRFVSLSRLMFEPAMVVHVGQRDEAIEYSTRGIYDAFCPDDKLEIAKAMENNWGSETLSTFLSGVRSDG